MKLSKGHHLAYCTNVHRGNNWAETFYSLQTDVMKVRNALCPDDPYAIGLRLGAGAARELSQPGKLRKFKQWLKEQNSYVFTINGFPFGNFHGQRVKEEVYRPDWADPRRLEYTESLFLILTEILPKGTAGSVSTLPASFKEFYPKGNLPELVFDHLIACAETIDQLSEEKGLDLHLGLEPEPLGWFETIPETTQFFEHLFKRATDQEMVRRRIGVNYDCCHLAIEYEDAKEGLDTLRQQGIRLSKLHLSSALRARPTHENLASLKSYAEEVYLHQVITAREGRVLERIKDLDLALELADQKNAEADEWRIHFHVPLHGSPGNGLADTREHVLNTMDWLKENPSACHHLEMETYTWEVLPEELRTEEVSDQVIREYQWTLAALKERGLGR
jgi:hypothetical protein